MDISRTEIQRELAEELNKLSTERLDILLATLKQRQDAGQVDAVVSGWIEFEGNHDLFNEVAKNNCWLKFDDGSVCRYNDDHPRAIMTHFKIKESH